MSQLDQLIINVFIIFLWGFKFDAFSLYKKIDKILEKLLDENYVLQSSNAQNRQIEKIDRNKKNFKIGNNWHTDSRYVNNKRISNGFSYLVIVALEDFTRNTASTQFIKDSFKNFTKPKRFTQKKYNTLKMKSGSVCIMDTGITHRGGYRPKHLGGAYLTFTLHGLLNPILTIRNY